MMATHRQKAARKLSSICNLSYQQALSVINEALGAGYSPTSAVHTVDGATRSAACDRDDVAEGREPLLLLKEITAYRAELSTLMQVADPTLDQLVKIDATAFMICQIADHLSDGRWCDEFSERVFDKALEDLVAGRFTGWPDASIYGEAMVRFSRWPFKPDPREYWIANEGPWRALTRAGFATDSDGWHLTDAGTAQFFPDGPDGEPRADYLVYAFPDEYQFLNGEVVEIVCRDDRGQ